MTVLSRKQNYVTYTISSKTFKVGIQTKNEIKLMLRLLYLFVLLLYLEMILFILKSVNN